LKSNTVYEIESGECYESVNDQEDYQTEYWIRCKDKRLGIEYKQKKKGKRIEVDGVVLFTDEKLPPEDEWKNPQWDIRCTEEKTGMIVGLHHLYIPEHRKKIDEYIKSVAPFSVIEERKEDEQIEAMPVLRE
jgi:hypothetical protein